MDLRPLNDPETDDLTHTSRDANGPEPLTSATMRSITPESSLPSPTCFFPNAPHLPRIPVTPTSPPPQELPDPK